MNERHTTRWSWFKSETSEPESARSGSVEGSPAEPGAPEKASREPETPSTALPAKVPGNEPVEPSTAEPPAEESNALEERTSPPADADEDVETDEPTNAQPPDPVEAPLTARQAPFDPKTYGENWRSLPRRTRKKTLSKPQPPKAPLTPEQKLLLLDTWQRSGLPARDFAALVGMSRHTLHSWKQKFDKHGPAGLMDKPRGGRRGSRLPDLTKRAILMLKEAHPEWGCQRISDMLARGPALPASESAVSRVLHEAGYEVEKEPTKRHPDRVRSFERARPNQLWQTDLFTFTLKRQNRRVYLVAFLDDHSRFITGYGLHATQSAALVIEVLRHALTAYGPPKEILTDNGAQYVTWRGKSQFSKELEKRGIRQIVAKPRRPQTLGKIERFWGTLWRECLEAAVFLDLEEARQRIGLFIDWYNFQRPHRGVDGLVPADRFFDSAPEVLGTLKARVSDNALELARNGVPRKPFYLTGQVDGRPFSVHQEGDRVILRKAGESREEIELAEPSEEDADQEPEPNLPAAQTPDGSPQTAWSPPDAELPPGVSPLDTRPDETADETGGEA